MPDTLEILTGGLFKTSGVGLVTQGFPGIADGSLHPRTRIRNYIVALLRVAATDAANRVYAERADPFQARIRKWQLPALNVFTRDETSEVELESPRTLKRELEVGIDIIASGAQAEDELDNIAKVIEDLIGPDRFLGNNADDLFLSASPSEFNPDAAAKIGVIHLVYTVTYRTEVSQVVGAGLTKLHVDWDLAPPDHQTEAIDELQFIEE